MRWRVPVIVAAAAVLRLLAPGAVVAADPRYPDWPCNQLKVPEISVAAVWAGPSIDGVGGTWENDPKIGELVPRLAARRTPMDEAEKLIADFLTGGAAEKEDKAKRLFAGVFETLNRQRSEVMTGVERITRKQKVLDPRSLIAAEFIILGTSLPAEGYPAEELLAVYRLRWQIELAFKRMKSLLHIDRLPTRTDAGSLSWLYAHLILVLLTEDICQDFLESSP